MMLSSGRRGCTVVSRNWLNRFRTRIRSGATDVEGCSGGGKVAAGVGAFSGKTGLPGTAGVGSKTDNNYTETEKGEIIILKRKLRGIY